MNLKKQSFFYFLEYGNNNVIVNLFLTAAALILVQKNTGNFLVPAVISLNTLWLLTYTYFVIVAKSKSFNISKRGRELLLQFTAFYILTFLFWVPFATQKFFILGIISVNLTLLFVYLFRVQLKHTLLNLLNRGYEESSSKNILTKLSAYFGDGSSSDHYQSSFSVAGKSRLQSSINNLITPSSAGMLMFNEQIETQEAALDNAEYTFNKVNLGDTIADWLQPNYQYGNATLIKVRQLSNRILKRVFDVVVSLFVIVFFLSWMVPLIGLLIKLESKGPIFFKQLRSGLDNKAFWCYKFRSMQVNEESDELQATKGDTRITNIGAFLRKTSLDEFPQFFNVLKGEMSIVGPRPHMLMHTDFYGNKIEDYMKRLSMKQGLTGWAQIKGHRGETSDIKFMQDRVNHDLWYMHNWSFWLDVKIIVLTFLKIFKSEANVF